MEKVKEKYFILISIALRDYFWVMNIIWYDSKNKMYFFSLYTWNRTSSKSSIVSFDVLEFNPNSLII